MGNNKKNGTEQKGYQPSGNNGQFGYQPSKNPSNAGNHGNASPTSNTKPPKGSTSEDA